MSILSLFLLEVFHSPPCLGNRREELAWSFGTVPFLFRRVYSEERMLEEFKQFAAELARESGDVIRHYFRNHGAVDQKSDESPVTVADRKAEEVMRERITKVYPQHGVLGEEFGERRAEAEYTWVLDPIDGTLNFICGGLAFGTLIALLKHGQPILGVIHQPILGELLIGTESQTTLNGEIVRVRPCERLADAILLTTDPYLVREHRDIKAFERLREEVKVYRGWGDCYGYLLLATGKVDIMVDPIMHPWDIMALIPVVRGAGGTITDYEGKDPVQGNSTVATSGRIHRQVVDLLNSG